MLPHRLSFHPSVGRSIPSDLLRAMPGPWRLRELAGAYVNGNGRCLNVSSEPARCNRPASNAARWPPSSPPGWSSREERYDAAASRPHRADPRVGRRRATRRRRRVARALRPPPARRRMVGAGDADARARRDRARLRAAHPPAALRRRARVRGLRRGGLPPPQPGPRRGGHPPARDDRRRARAARAVAGDPAGRCLVARGPSSLARRDVDRVPRQAHRRARRRARGPDRRRRWSVSDRTATFERILAPEPGRTALLVVDMQRGFLEPGEAMEVPPARASVPVIRALVDLFRSRRLPVVFTAFVYSPDVPLLVGELHPEHKPAAPGASRGFGMPSSSCLAGSPSARVVAAPAPRPGEPGGDQRSDRALAGRRLGGARRARG